MAWLAVNKDGTEIIIDEKPYRNYESWVYDGCIESENFTNYGIDLPFGSIFKLIGKTLTWDDEPVEIK